MGPARARGPDGATEPGERAEPGDAERPAPLASLQDRPSAAELVAAVREFLERDVLGTVEGRVGFHTRVAVNALGMVERELVLGPGLDAAAHARLVAFLGHDDDLASLVDELASRIRAGGLDGDAETLAVARDLVAAKLEVSNPRYRTASER